MGKPQLLWRGMITGLLRSCGLIISLFLGLICNLGGCSSTTEPDPVEYGMPYADFKIKGTVRNLHSEEPIRGFSVSLRDTLDNSLISDEVLTDSLGNYIIEIRAAPWENTWMLHAEDIDGAENGRFDAVDSLISIPQSEIVEPSPFFDDEWYAGWAELDIDLDLDEIEE